MTLKDLYYKTKYILLINLIFILSACSEPDYRLVDGGSGKVDDFLGKWLIVNYWADWCPPCIKEMPELSSFYEDNKKEVHVFAYNFDQLEGEELEEQILRFKVQVPSLLTDPGELFGWDVPDGLPTTYIIDPKGVTREVLLGPQTKESLEEMILKLKET